MLILKYILPFLSLCYSTLVPIPIYLEGPQINLDLTVEYVSLLEGPWTEVWTYGGTWPGPTLITQTKNPLYITHTNLLPTNEVCHHHGLMADPAADGHPTDVIGFNQTKEYNQINYNEPSMYWYHSHSHGFTGYNINKGLAGFYLIEDDYPRGIPLMLQDRKFDHNNQFIYNPTIFGFFGNYLFVNGVTNAVVQVNNTVTRLYILNAADTRNFHLTLSDGLTFLVVGTDGGLLQDPEIQTDIFLSPAERVQVLIDFTLATTNKIYLSNIDEQMPLLIEVLTFEIADQSSQPNVYENLNNDITFPSLATEYTVTRTFIFDHNQERQWTINGLVFDINRIDAYVKANSTELWRIENHTNIRHNIHLHLVQYRIVGNPSMALKDTAVIEPNTNIELEVNFQTFWTGRYVFHCHYLAHGITLMGQFEVEAV